MPCESDPCNCAHSATSAAISASARERHNARRRRRQAGKAPAASHARPHAILRSLPSTATSVITVVTLAWRREKSFQRCDGRPFRRPLPYSRATAIFDQPFKRQRRPIPTEHDAILKSPADLLFKGRGEIFRRPAVHFIMNIRLVQQHGNHIVLPWPRRPAGKKFQLRKSRGNPVDMTRVAILEDNSFAARHPLSDASQPGHQQHGRANIDRQLVERVPDRIACRISRGCSDFGKSPRKPHFLAASRAYSFSQKSFIAGLTASQLP